LVDGVVTGGGFTDPSGAAQITFRRVLTVGDHRVDLKFAGSRVAAPTSASTRLSVLPVDGARLTVEPLPKLQVGRDPTVCMVAHVVLAAGETAGSGGRDAR